MERSGVQNADAWPALPLDEWKDTYATLHMWTQIIGKIRLALSPLSEPLVERAAVRKRTRSNHVADSVPQRAFRTVVRLH